MSPHTVFRVAAIAALTWSLAACADDGPSSSAGSAGSGGEGAAAAAPVAAGTLQPGDTIEFLASEFAFAPMELTAEPGTYEGVLINDGSIKHDIQFGDGDADRRRSRRDRHVRLRGSGGRHRLPVLDPGPCRRRHGRHGRTPPVRSGPPMTGTAAAADVVEADPEAPPYEWRDPVAPERGEGDGITLVPGGARRRWRSDRGRDGGRGEADDRRRGLRAAGLDVQRQRPRTRDPHLRWATLSASTW